VNPPNLKELAEQIAIPVRHLRYLLEQMEWHIPKATVWAFGSRIKWSHRPESDLDLAVHCDKETGRKGIPKLNDALQESDLPFNVQILDFNRLPENMQENIKKNYLVLYQPQEIPLPTGWKETTLGEVAEIIGGFAFKGEHFSNSEGVPVIKITDIKPPYVDIDNSQRIALEQYDKDRIKKFLLGKGDYLVAMTGATIGKVGRIASHQTAYLNQRVAKIDALEGVADKDFCYYLVFSHNFTKFIEGFSSGSSVQQNISADDIGRYPVFLPPLAEQKVIAAILSSFDDKIELLRRQNKTLESIAQTIFKEWFVKFNFPGATGKMIDSELGEIPEGWRVGTVNDVIERFSITYRCDQDDLSPKGKTPILDQGSNGLYGYTERDPDFQASTENPVVVFANHTCNMWFTNYPFCAIQNIIPFRGNSEYSTFFVFYMTLGQISFIEYKGHWPDFEQKEYVIPKPDIADRFAEIMKPLQYKIWNDNSQIQTLLKLRDTLLPKLMKGEIRVKDTKFFIKEKVK